MARPSKFRPEIIATILDGLKNGLPRIHAAARAGISETTFFYWMGHPNEYRVFPGLSQPFTHACVESISFCDAVNFAESVFVSNTVKHMYRISETHWESAAWLLERRFPEQFGRRATSEATILEIQEQIEKLLPTESNSGAADNPGTDLIIISVDGENTNIAALDKMARAAHGDYVSSYVGDHADALKNERQRDKAFGQLLDAYNLLRAQVDHTMSEKQAA